MNSESSLIDSNKMEEEKEQNIYQDLKKNLLNGEISFLDLRDKLVEMDQATTSHDAATTNLNFLKDPEVNKLVQEHPEIIDGYNRLLSFTEFHIAQSLAISDDVTAIDHLNEALKSALESGDESWTAYVKGTQLYLSGEKIPNEIIDQVTSENNKKILLNFNVGLDQRGVPSYGQDYFRV